MKEMARYGLTLGIICTLAAGLLASVNSLTSKKIIAQAVAEEEAGLKEVLAMANKFEAVKKGEDTFYYKAYNGEGKFIGVVFKTSSKGYSSNIETLAGMLKDGTITAIKVLAQNETPGLGSRICDADFTGRFKEKKDLSQVEAITGATISSSAVIKSVKKMSEEMKALIENEK